jgi:2-iminobutanoate/2-iminopropanoate deaminase
MAVKRSRIQPPGMHVRMAGGQPVYSHVVTVEGHGKVILVAGQVARDENGDTVGPGDMRAQIEQVGRNLEACLKAAGASLSDIVKTVTYVTDLDEFFKHADMRMRYLGPSGAVSTTVEISRLAGPGLMVEIEAIAVVD